MRPLFYLGTLVFLMAGCGSGGERGSSPDGIPADTKPCDHPEYWPLELASENHPFVIHYRRTEEAETAAEIRTELDAAWALEFEELGYTPVPSDEGQCGPDGRFDVFVWRDHRSCFVDVISEKIVTPAGGRASYMLLDPWGPYGGAILGQTVGHELNHGSQAANDWHESGISFEMTSTYVEQYFGAGCADCIHDFQLRPDWSLLWYDDYKTWYMYGSALFMHFLRDFYFNGDERFLPALWREVRNHPDLNVNSPNWIDGLNTMLAPQGGNFEDAAVHFARWRYFTAGRDDGRHFRRWPFSWAQLPFMPQAELAIPSVTLKETELLHQLYPAPMLYGTAYLRVAAEDPSRESFQFTLLRAEEGAVRWVVQAVPGIAPGSDGETIAESAQRIAFAPGGERTLIISALPEGPFDPDHQSGKRYAAAIRLAP